MTPFSALGMVTKNTPISSNADFLFIEQKGLENNKVNWHLKVNSQNLKLKDTTLKMSLLGNHSIDLLKLNSLMNDKGITVTQPNPLENDFLLNIKELEEEIIVDFLTDLQDSNQSNYEILLSTHLNSQQIEASDIYYVKTELSGEVKYSDVPKDVVPPTSVIQLIDKKTQSVINQVSVNPNDKYYVFNNIRKFDDNNELIDYEVRPIALGNYEAKVKNKEVELQFLSTDISGTIDNKSNKPLNLKVINKSNSLVISDLSISPEATTYQIENLPLNDEEGQKIEYGVIVDDIDGFKVTISDYKIVVNEIKENPKQEKNELEEEQLDKLLTEKVKTEKTQETNSNFDDSVDKITSTEEITSNNNVLEGSNESSSVLQEEDDKEQISPLVEKSVVYLPPKDIPILRTFNRANINLLGFAPMNNVAGVADDPSPTYKGRISNMAWDEKGLYRNRTPQPVEYNESFQWKTAQSTNVLNEYVIDLKTQGRASVTQETVDIVLVVDNSASMGAIIGNGKTRWQSMKDDVFQFIDEVTQANTGTNTKVRIDVVNFASALRPSINTGFSGNPTIIKSKFYSSYVPSGQGGGTFTQEGLRSGSELLSKSSASKKVMIVLTDGAPTLSYKGTRATGSENITSFSRVIKGNGTNFKLHGNSTYYADHDPYFINRYTEITNHGQPTISEAKLIKNSRPDFDIFSIGLDTTVASGGATEDDMNNVLNNIASRLEYAFTTADSASELSKTLSKISQSVSNSISNGVVTDPIGAMYDLNLGSDNILDKSDYTLTASNPDLLNSVTVNYDPNTKTLRMNGLNLGKGEWVNLNYKVKLRVTDDNFVENQWYPMNGTTTLKPSNSSINLREYPVPEAKAKSPSYSFVFNKVDDDEKPLQGAVFELKDVNGKIWSKTSSSSGQVLFDNLKKGRYTLTEKSAPNGFIKDSKVYNVVIASNGEIRIDNVLYTDTNNFKIINKKLLGSIEVIKHKTGNENELLRDAKFELRNSAGDLIDTLTTGTDGKILFKALPLGSYTLKEVQAPSGYQLNSEPINITVKNDEKVTIKVANKSNSDILPNTGGTGTIFYTLLGMLIIVIAVWSRKKVLKL